MKFPLYVIGIRADVMLMIDWYQWVMLETSAGTAGGILVDVRQKEQEMGIHDDDDGCSGCNLQLILLILSTLRSAKMRVCK